MELPSAETDPHLRLRWRPWDFPSWPVIDRPQPLFIDGLSLDKPITLVSRLASTWGPQLECPTLPVGDRVSLRRVEHYALATGCFASFDPVAFPRAAPLNWCISRGLSIAGRRYKPQGNRR